MFIHYLKHNKCVVIKYVVEQTFLVIICVLFLEFDNVLKSISEIFQ